MRFYEVQLRMTDGEARTEEVSARDHVTAQRRAVIIVGAHKVEHVVGSRRAGGIGSIG